MRKLDEYLATIDTIYPDGYQREHVFRDAGDMVDAKPFPRMEARTRIGRIIAALATRFNKRQSRLSLRDLSPEQLKDIGISRMEADEELNKARLLAKPTRSL